jgi:hypothetical protein
MPLSDEERALLDGEFATSKTEQAPDVRGILERSAGIQPERHAQVLDIATRRQLPVSTVDNNFDELKQRDAIDAADPSTFGPHLTKFFSDPDNAGLAHDDVENLKATEKAFALAPVAQQVQNIGKGIKNIAGALAAGQHRTTAGAYGLLEGGVDILRGMTTDQMINAGLIENDQVLKPISDFFGKARKNSQQWGDYLAPDADTLVERGVYGGLESFSSNATSMALSVIAGNPAYALGLMTGQTGGSAMGEGKDQGMQIDDRLLYATTDAAIEYVTEKNPVTKLIEDLTGNSGFVKSFISQQVSEGIGEQAATALQDLNAWALLPENKDKPFSAYIAERPNAALETMVSTFVATGVNTGVMHGISKLAQPAVTATDRNATKVQESAVDQDRLDQITTLAQSSKLGGIATEKYKEFLAGAASDQKIYVPMDIVRDIPGLPDSVTSQISDLGGDVEIPVADYMAHIATDEKLLGMLRPHLTMGADKFSAHEIQTGAADKTVRSLLERANVSAELKSETDKVWESVTQQLIATGRMSESQAKTSAVLYPAMIATMAKERGLKPQEIVDRMGLTIVGPDYKPGAGAPAVNEEMDQENPVYPIASRDEWHGEADYQDRGGQIVTMSPDEFLKNAPPLDVNDELTRENIDELKKHIQSGKKLDPLTLYKLGAENTKDSDGRHRAIAAKELGITQIPVVDFTFADSKVTDQHYVGMPSEMVGQKLKPNDLGLIFTTPDANEANAFAGGAKGANVVPVRVNAKNPFDPFNPDHLAAIDAVAEDNLWDSANVENADTIAKIKAAGFDGLYVKDRGSRQEKMNLAVFDSSQVRPTMGGSSQVQSNALSDMKDSLLDEDRWLDRGLKLPAKAKIYRGTSARTGKNTANLGKGLYTTTDKKQASQYGDVSEMSRSDAPQNPIRFSDEGAYRAWESNVYKELGLSRMSEFDEQYGTPDNWVRMIDPTIDGIQIGDGGNGTWFVKFKPADVTLNQSQRTVDVLIDFYEKVANQEDEVAFQTPTSTAKEFDDIVKDLAGDQGWFAKNQTTNKKYINALDGEGRAPVIALYTEAAVEGMPHPDAVMEIYYEGSLDREGNVKHTDPYVSILPGSGKNGRAMYQMAMMWAHNNGKTLAPDHAGITMINRLRRTEAMISSALRFKTTKHLEPHHHQFVGLLPTEMYARLEDEHGAPSDINEFKEGGKNHDIELALLDLKNKYWKVDTGVKSVYKSNLRNLMVASQRLVERRFPEAANIGFKPNGEYYDQTTGETIDPERWIDSHRDKNAAYSAGIGNDTLRRSSITKSALLEERRLGRMERDSQRRGALSPAQPVEPQMVENGDDWFGATPAMSRILYQEGSAPESSDVQTRQLAKRRDVVKLLLNCLEG